MADEMQGIMSLPEQPAMEQAAAPTAEQSAAVEQMRSQLSPSEVNTEMLGAAEEADPATVAEFKAELQGLELPPEVLDMLNTMVEEILDAPQDYEAIRAKYMAQGLEDLLPPEFDATFFGALNMAIDQIRGASLAGQPAMASGVNTVEDIFTYNPAAAAPMAPQGFAQGGIASLGRNGDTMLAHINPEEAAMLRRRGGSGSINPRTGLPEFFSLKGAFKKIGSAVKKFASSTVGKIVIGAALFMVAGPAAAAMLGVSAPAAVSAVSGFVAGAGGNLLAGGNLKDSLKIGAKGALTAGALTGVTQGASAFKGVPKPTAGATTFPATDTGAGITRTPLENTAATTSPGINTREGIMRSPIAAAGSTPATSGSSAMGVGSLQDFTVDMGPGAAPLSAQAAPFKIIGYQGDGVTPLTQGQFDRTMQALRPPLATGDLAATQRVIPAGGEDLQSLSQTSSPTIPLNKTPGFFESIKNVASPAEGTTRMGSLKDAFLPGKGPSVEDVLKSKGLTLDTASAVDISKAEILAKSMANSAIRQYAPIVGAGLGIMAATGGFEAEQPQIPAGFEDMAAGRSPGQKLLTERPDQYGLQFGGVNTTYAPNPYDYMFAPPPRPTPIARRNGGIAELTGYRAGGDPSQFPRKNGHINGPGTGTSDDVPAMLSDGEFVFTAKAVRSLGDGSRRKGAKRMLALMKKLEGRSNG